MLVLSILEIGFINVGESIYLSNPDQGRKEKPTVNQVDPTGDRKCVTNERMRGGRRRGCTAYQNGMYS